MRHDLPLGANEREIAKMPGCALPLPSNACAALTYSFDGYCSGRATNLSEDGNTIAWGRAQLPAPEGCTSMSISLGTWRRG